MTNRARMEAEADMLERGAEILSRAIFGAPGPTRTVSELERALEILLRNEAARTRYKARKRSEAEALLFRDEAMA